MTTKQLNKLNPEKFLMVTFEFGNPIYIKPIEGLSAKGIKATGNKEEAEVWGYADTLSPHKLDYYKVCSGYKGLEFINQ